MTSGVGNAGGSAGVAEMYISEIIYSLHLPSLTPTYPHLPPPDTSTSSPSTTCLMAATRGSLVVPRAMRGLFSVGRTARDLFSAGRPALRPATRLFSSSVAVSSPAHPKLLSLARLDDDAHHALAKNWLDQFTPEDIPKHAYEVSYARSSGPGGQHVNTTNSKAVVRCDIHRAKGDWLPLFVMPALQQSVSRVHRIPSRSRTTTRPRCSSRPRRPAARRRTSPLRSSCCTRRLFKPDAASCVGRRARRRRSVCAASPRRTSGARGR